MDAVDALRRQIKRIRLLEYVPAMIAGEVAARTAQIVENNVRAQVGPDGVPWAPSRTGRASMLQNAPARMEVRLINPTIIQFRLTGRYARHHLGAVRGKIARPIIPTRTVPQPVIRAIQEITRDAIENVITKGIVKPNLASEIARMRADAATKAG